MLQKLWLRIAALLILAAVFVMLLCMPSTIEKPKDNDVSKSQTDNSDYVLKLQDSKVSLLKDDKIIKTYDIIPSLLPGEDILSLTKGIEVADIAQADSIAEDFDG